MNSNQIQPIPPGGHVSAPKTILSITEDEDTYTLTVSKNIVSNAVNALKLTRKGTTPNGNNG